jgi:hypothetical protein
MNKIITAICITFFSILGQAQCAAGEVEIELIVHTDNYGYEGYWEITPSGDPCGTNTIASGGNTAVGCNGAGDQSQTPGGYGNNQTITEGPWCLSENTDFALHFIDDWGDGGFSFDVVVNGFQTITLDGIGLGGTYSFTATEPSGHDLSVFSVNMNSYVEFGSYLLECHVFNAGTNAISSYDLNYSVNGGPTFTSTIAAGSLGNYQTESATHSVSLDVTEFGVYTLQIWADQLDGSIADENTSNDTLTKIFEAGPGIPNIIDTYVGAGFAMEQVAGPSQQVNRPTDLDFHPVLTNNELWVTNKGTEASGGSTVTIYNAGEAGQTSIYKQDGNAWHFMSLPTGIAFSQNGNWANSPGVYDANHNGGAAYTGPALWSSDMSIYAEDSGGNGSHLDMLHASPECQGIAAEIDNVFWVFDGYTSDIVRYDFQEDHGPGNDDHGDAIIRRYSDDTVTKDANDQIVSHLVLDKNAQWLYVVDHGNGRVIRIDINTGSDMGGAPNYPNPEPVAEYTEYTGYTQELVISGLNKPSGIDVIDDRLILSDYENGEISIYDISIMPAQLMHTIPTSLSSVQGVKIGPDGRIWFVDYDTDAVNVLTSAPLGVNEIVAEYNLYPNPSTGIFNLHSINAGQILGFSVYDAQGRKVLDEVMNSDFRTIDLTHLPSGLFEVRIQSKLGFSTERLIKE